MKQQHRFFYTTLIFTLVLSWSATAQSKKPVKGLLQEVSPSKDKDINDEKEQSKALAGELLVNKAEDEAIKALEKLIFKAKTNPNSGSDLASLKFRLAELYIRKAKSGRFFDLYQDLIKKDARIDQQTIASTKPSLRKAIATLKDIEESHPKFEEMDVAFFNIANAYSALNETAPAEIYFENLINRYPNSALRPDALLSLGEIHYQKGRFELALKLFDEIKKYPEAKAYPYSLYKSAWCSYNIKQNEIAIQKLVESLDQNNKMLTENQKHNLRSETLKDLVLFSGEVKKPDEMISFFKKLTNQEEFDDAMLSLAKLYESHSRHSELVRFLKDYKAESNAQNKSWAQVYVVNSLEAMKKRKEVIEALKEFSDICKKDTSTDQVCLKRFQTVSREISQKWWEIWEKNKKHEEFSGLTTEVFEILLTQDDGSSDMAKNRISYADLLFQKELYSKSAENYLKAARATLLDIPNREEAFYSSIVSYDKQIAALQETKKDQDREIKRIHIEQIIIVEEALKLKTQNKYTQELYFKEIFNHYQLKNYDEVKKKLKLNLSQFKKGELREKVQDIEFDILNQEKNYPLLSQKLDEAIKTEKNKDRTAALKKLRTESLFAEIVNGKWTTPEKIAKLEAFRKTSEMPELSEKAQALLISSYFENKQQKQASDLVYEDAYLKGNKNKYTEDQLKETLNYMMILGEEDKVRRVLSKTDPLAHCEYLTLLRRGIFASECYIQIYDKLKDDERRKTAQLLVKEALEAEPLEKRVKALLQKDTKNSDLLVEFEIRNLEKVIEEKKWTEAFNLAKKYLARDIEQSLKARVRLVQSKVLAQEFLQQSVKAKVDRLAIVLSLKTEKLDKAYQGFNAVLSYKPDGKTQLDTLKNIEMINSHYVQALTDYPRPEGLSDEEFEGLMKELATLAKPIAERNIEIRQQIEEVEKTLNAKGNNYLWMVQLKNYDFIESPKNEAEKTSFTYLSNKLKNGHLMLVQFLLTEAMKVWPESSWTKELNFYVLGANQKFDEIKKNYDKNFFTKVKTPEGKSIVAISQYQNKKFSESFQTFSEIDKELLYNYRLEAEHLNAGIESKIERPKIEKLSQDYLKLMKGKKDLEREDRIKNLIKDTYEKNS